MTRILLFLHFVGLVMGFSATFANMVVLRLTSSATPSEAEVLRRVPRQMLRLSSWGVALLFVTGPALVYSRYGGAWGTLPWVFWVKMVAVAALVVVYGFLHVNMRRARQGDATAGQRLQYYGPMATAAATVAVIFAIIAFD